MHSVRSFNLVGLLGLLSAATLIICVFVLTTHMDRAEVQRERALLAAKLAADMQASQASMQVWSRNDEAVRRLDYAQDPAWARSTFPSVKETGIAVYTLDYANRIVSGPDSSVATDRQLRAGRDLPSRIAAIRATFRAAKTRAVSPAGSLFWHDGALYLMFVSPFLPASPGIKLHHAAPPILAAICSYQSFLDTNLAGMGFKGVVVRQFAASKDDLAITDSHGQTVGWIDWQKARPGADLRAVILWPMLTLTSAFVALLVFAHLRALSSQRKLIESEARATHMALHDQLTDLANRRCLVESLERAIEEANKGRDLALLLIDLDRFKQVNDTYGHQCGDELIRETASRLKSVCRSALDLCARLGGDEFVILARDCDPATAERLATRVLTSLSQPVSLSVATIQPAGSVGVAIFHGESSPESLLREADHALYSAKGNGRNTFCIASTAPAAIADTKHLVAPAAAA